MVVLVWIILIVVIILVALKISRRYGRRVTEQQIIKSQHTVNLAMRQGIDHLIKDHAINSVDYIESTLVANIWGHNVMAFEFQLPVMNKRDVLYIRQQLNQELALYAHDNNLVSAAEDRPALLVTDVWYDNSYPILHVDVAHVVNAETSAYLRDLRRLNQKVQ